MSEYGLYVEGIPLNRKSRMSPRLQWTLKVRDSDLPAREKLVAFALSTFMDNEEATCHPSFGVLASAASIHRRTAEKAIQVLHRGGWLHRRGDMHSRRGGKPIAVWEGRVPFTYQEFPDVG